MPAQIVVGMYMQIWEALAVLTVANLGIADAFTDSPRSVAEVARSRGLCPQALFRLLRAVSRKGIFYRTGADTFKSTALSDALKAGAPGGARELIRACGMPSTRVATAALEQIVATGRPAVELLHGLSDQFERLEADPVESDVYDKGMQAAAEAQVEAILEAFDFSGFSCVVDVGGGTGALLCGVLARNPAARGILLEVPRVAAKAADVVRSRELLSRCEIQSGDFRKHVPPGGDAYVLKNVLHGHSDAQCREILAQVGRAARSGAQVLIIELVMPDEGESTMHASLDVFLLLGGAESRVRSRKEFETLLPAGELELVKIVPCAFGACVIQTRKQ